MEEVKLGTREIDVTLNESFFKIVKNGFIKTQTVLESHEIIGFRYGINWIEYHLNFGREYIIEIKTNNEKTHKISLTSYLTIKLKERHKFYTQIVDGLWDFYFEKIINSKINEFHDGKDVTIENVIINKSGVTIQPDNGFVRKDIEITWDDLGTKTYDTYYSIYSKKNPTKVNRGYSFKEDWNTSVLYSVIEFLLKNL